MFKIGANFLFSLSGPTLLPFKDQVLPTCTEEELRFCFPPEMNNGLDLDWTGCGLWRIMLILDWIQSVKCFTNFGSRLDLDWVNGQDLRISCH